MANDPKEANRSPKADGRRRNPRRRRTVRLTCGDESQGSQSVAQSGRETSQPAPQPDRSTAPVANESQGSQSIARSGETSQPAPQADNGTLPEAARAAMVIASQDKPQAPPDAPAPAATLASEAAPVDAPQRPAEAAPKVEGKVVVGGSRGRQISIG